MLIRIRLPFTVHRSNYVDEIKNAEKKAIESINKRSTSVLRDINVNIFCKHCNFSIAVSKEPTVFGSRDSSESGTYHMRCWKNL